MSQDKFDIEETNKLLAKIEWNLGAPDQELSEDFTKEFIITSILDDDEWWKKF